ncbi:MAG: hypothetical protein HQ591_00400 [candidate division Zixibacteria bacterium]|nr:hypothetical protein [Candidatus Tariuqbacter arcticus]
MNQIVQVISTSVEIPQKGPILESERISENNWVPILRFNRLWYFNPISCGFQKIDYRKLFKLLETSTTEINNYEEREIHPVPIPKKVYINLVKLCELEDDWDGYGGTAVSKVITEKARKVIENIYYHLKSPLDSIWVGPSVDGGVQIEISKNNKELELEINPGQSFINIVFVIEKAGDRTYNDQQIQASQINEVVKWLQGEDCY